MTDALGIVLGAFAKRVGIEIPLPAVGKGFALVFDGRRTVNFAYENGCGRIRLFSCIAGSIDVGRDAPHVADEARVEWFDASEAGATFPLRLGFRPDVPSVILETVADAAQLDAVAFEAWLDSFLNQIEKWETALGGEQAGAGSSRR
jgi:hypothetical protein